MHTDNRFTLPVADPNINRIEHRPKMPHYLTVVIPHGIMRIVHFVKVLWFIMDFEYICIGSMTSFKWWTKFFFLISQHFICLFCIFILPHHFRCFQWKANVRQYARYSYGKLNTRNEKSLHWVNQSHGPQTSKDHMITAYMMLDFAVYVKDFFELEDLDTKDISQPLRQCMDMCGATVWFFLAQTAVDKPHFMLISLISAIMQTTLKPISQSCLGCWCVFIICVLRDISAMSFILSSHNAVLTNRRCTSSRHTLLCVN